MSNLEVLITFIDETTASYTLDPQTTLAQVKELLKEDELITGEELFMKSDQKIFIPKSQEKVKTITEFQVGDVAKLGIKKKSPPKTVQGEEEKKEDLSSPTKTGETTQGFEKEFAKEIKENDVSSHGEKKQVSNIKHEVIENGQNATIDVTELSLDDIKNILNKCVHLDDSLRFQIMDLLRTDLSRTGGNSEEKTYDNGDYYEGDFGARGQREGKGTMKYANGNYYEGDWKNDKMEGYGTFKWTDGDMYRGDWINGARDGKGEITYGTGEYYEGTWVNDRKEGQGKYTKPDGRVYEGGWINDKREGLRLYR